MFMYDLLTSTYLLGYKKLYGQNWNLPVCGKLSSTCHESESWSVVKPVLVMCHVIVLDVWQDTDQPLESGIGRVGNKRVTSKRDYKYQRLDGEACIFCWWQGCQYSRKSHDRLSCGWNQSQDSYFRLNWPCLLELVTIGLVCCYYLSWDIRLVWRKFHFCCGTAVSSICVT